MIAARTLIFLAQIALLVAAVGCAPKTGIPQKEDKARISDLVSLGLYYYEEKRYTESLQNFHQALGIAETTGDQALQTDIYFKIGHAQLKLQKFRAAIDAFELALTNTNTQSEVWEAGVLNNAIGGAYQALGDVENARRYFEISLPLRQQAGDALGEAQTLANLASTFFIEGRYLTAIELYEDASVLLSGLAPDARQEYGSVLTSLGAVYAEMGQYGKSLSMHEDASEVFEKIGDSAGVSTVLHNLGFVYFQQQDFCRAVSAFEAALGLRGKEGDPLVRAETLNSLALALTECDQQYGKALEFLVQAKEIQSKAVVKNELAATLDSIGTVYRRQGEYDKALQSYNESLLLSWALSNRDNARTTLGNIGIALQEQGQREGAIVFFKMSVNTTQALRGELKTLPKVDQRAYRDRVEGFYRRLAGLLVDLGRLAEAEQVLAMLKEEEYFDFIRRRRTQGPALAETMEFTPIARPFAERYKMIERELVRTGQTYENLQDRQARGLSQEEEARLKRLDADMMVARKAFRVNLRELEEAFLSQGPQRAKEFGEKELKSLRQVQAQLKQLGPGVVLIHTLLTDERLRLLLTTPEQQLHRDSPITAEEINRRVVEFRDVLQDPRSDPLPQAQALYRNLLQPLEEDLRQAKAQTLLISLDDTLRYLPFAALHDGKHYLAERYALVIYTAAARTHLTTPPQPNWRVAGLGVSEGAGGEFGALPAVRQELDAIVQEEGKDDPIGVLSGVVILDQEFTSARLSAGLRAGYPVVHIASHFKFRPGSELDSFLLLGSGQKLTLADIQDGDFPLTEVDLLTLSACETAYGGRDARGREIEGFGVLAQHQGAKAVLATLWPVADASTAAFMAAFYHRQDEGLTKAEALRKTQEQFLQGDDFPIENKGDSSGRGAVASSDSGVAVTSTSETRYRHPYFWAPFVLMGNGL